MSFAIYIHYPFCIYRCPYCGFATAVERAQQSARYRRSLSAEILRCAELPPWQGGSLYSVYFGGGTPSLMPPEYCAAVLSLIQSAFPPPPDASIEITLEANPGTRDTAHFLAYRAAGVNRLSIGAQSFHSGELKILGRAHTPGDVEETVNFARECGFDNVSIDLIYGVPGQTVASFAESLHRTLALDVDHLSTYALTIESGTPFERRVARGKLPPPDPDLAAEQFDLLCAAMQGAGFEHYELTNFSRPGKWSRHNYAYWRRMPYLGLGCGAHSFDGRLRSWNLRNTEEYIRLIEAGASAESGRESLTSRDELEEFVYLSLRTRDGLGVDFTDKITPSMVLTELQDAQLLERRNGCYHIPENRWLLLDEIVLKLLPEASRGADRAETQGRGASGEDT